MNKYLDSILEASRQEREDRKTSLEIQKRKMAERLKETVLNNGLSIAQFARNCNIPHETIKKYISGEHLIRVDALEPMADVLNVSIEYLLCVDNEKTAKDNIPILDRIEKATNLSRDAISSLISLKNESEYIECIDTILKEKTILDKFVQYFVYIKNRNNEEYNICINNVSTTTNELEYLPQAEMINSENVLIYKLMKEFEASVERKYKNQNSDLEMAYRYQLMKEIETVIERKINNRKKKGTK